MKKAKKKSEFVVVRHELLVPREEANSVIELLDTENTGEVYSFGCEEREPTKLQLEEYQDFLDQQQELQESRKK